MESSAPGTAAQRLARMIRGIRVAMLTTAAADGSLHARPMATRDEEHEDDFTGELWFFTKAGSGKVDEILGDGEVNLSYVSLEDHRYISISGRATLVTDQEKIDALWSPTYRAWFSRGLDEPDLALLRVEARTARYWDMLSGGMIELPFGEPDRGRR